jgi:hypothetical protein
MALAAPFTRTAGHRSNPLQAPLAGPVVYGEDLGIFQQIHDPSVELILWRRRLAADFSEWLSSLPVENLPDGRITVAPSRARSAIDALFMQSGMPTGSMRNRLCDDMTMLVRLFSVTLAIDHVDVRVETIQNDACWRFHRDCVRARLLTTYCGPGTQWVDPIYSAQAIAEQRAYSGVLRDFQRNDVGLFKGNCSPPASGIVHRSPPIRNTGQVRVILCLNIPSAVSPGIMPL